MTAKPKNLPVNLTRFTLKLLNCTVFNAGFYLFICLFLVYSFDFLKIKLYFSIIVVRYNEGTLCGRRSGPDFG